MKSSKVAMVGLGLLVMAGLALGQDAAKVAAPSELKDMKAKASYAIGLGLGRNLKSAARISTPTCWPAVSRTRWRAARCS